MDGREALELVGQANLLATVVRVLDGIAISGGSTPPRSCIFCVVDFAPGAN